MPKIIHYFLEGIQPYDYKESWEICCPDYEIRKWTASDVPYDEYPNLRILYENGKWSMLSDFVRHWAVMKFGGFYLDTDVELIRSLDSLLDINSFVCIEGYPVSGNAAVCGGHVGAWFQIECVKRMGNMDMQKLLNEYLPEIEISPRLVSSIIKDVKGANLDESDLRDIKYYKDFITLPKQYFYPFNWNEHFEERCVTPETIGIHWWKHSWK